jgi:hypothetical protein
MDSGHGEGELKKMMGLGDKMYPWGWIVAMEKVSLGN